MNAPQLSNIRSPILKNVSCCNLPARALRPTADSAILSNACWSYRCKAFSPDNGMPAAILADVTCCSKPADAQAVCQQYATNAFACSRPIIIPCTEMLHYQTECDVEERRQRCETNMQPNCMRIGCYPHLSCTCHDTKESERGHLEDCSGLQVDARNPSSPHM